MLVLNTFLICTIFSSFHSSYGKLSPSLLKSLSESPSVTSDILVSFKDCKAANVLKKDSISGKTGPKDSRAVVPLSEALRNYAEGAQKDLLEYLQMEKFAKSPTNGNLPFDFHSLWISNRILVKNATRGLIDSIAQFPQVESITEDELHSLRDFKKPMDTRSSLVKSVSLSSSNPFLNTRSPGLQDLEREGITGRGVVIGFIDSGVNAQNIFLRGNFRGNYGWFDAVNGYTTPYDDHGHGSHAVGVAAGAYGMGTASQADYMACKGLSSGGLYRESWLELCASFMMCPWDALGQRDCSKKPRIVAIPWTLPNGMRHLDNIVEAFHQEGILTVVSAGDAGHRGCASVMPPGDIPSVLTVGGMNQTSNLVIQSTGMGPGLNNSFKPDLTAPGWNVVSASSWGQGLQVMSGSGPAAAHVAGVAALVLQKNPKLKMGDLRTSILNGAIELKQGDRNCAEANKENRPNMNTGFGVVNARGSVSIAPK